MRLHLYVHISRPFPLFNIYIVHSTDPSHYYTANLYMEFQELWLMAMTDLYETRECLTSRALPSESLPALPWDFAGGRPQRSGGNPKVILLVTFFEIKTLQELK